MIKNIIIISISVLISISLTSLFIVKEFNKKLADLEQKTPKIVAVDTSVLFKDFVLAIQHSIEDKKGLSTQETENLIQKKISTHKVAVDLFNEEIVKISEKNNLIILDKNGVISGVPDETIKAKELLKQLMGGIDD